MPCGGGGFAGGGPGRWMRWEGKGVRPGFSGRVPGLERSWERGQEGLEGLLGQVLGQEGQRV
eukprot:956058-Rhodomonas_salina.1